MPVTLVMSVLVAYANSFSAPFVFDDIPTIVENPALRDFFGRAAETVSSQAGGLTLSGRPIVALSLALNYALSGYAVWSYHAFNVIIHALAALALFGVLRRTLPRTSSNGSDAPTDSLAFAIALLWAIHPLQTESVTYVVQRAESLMGLFYLLTFYAFIRSLECHPLCDTRLGRSALGWRHMAIIACALGMATKEVMVTAPVMVLLYDRTFATGSFAEAWRARKNFYLGLAATWLVLAYSVISTGGNRGGTVGFNIGVTPWAYALTQAEAVTRYVGLALWPHPLVFDYGTFWVERVSDVLPYALIVLAFLGITIWALFRRPMLGFAGAWFFGILAPTSLTPGTIQMIVEHRMYLPLAAILAVVAIGVQRWTGRAAPWIGAAVIVACFMLTPLRNADYRSELALWSATVAGRPVNSIAQNNLGLALFRLGRVSEAVERYERAVQIDPRNLEARYNLALAQARLERWPAAFEQYREVLRRKPEFAAARSNYGSALLKAGQGDTALAEFRAALKSQPDLAEAHSNLSEALLQSGQLAEATTEAEIALRLKPTLAEAHYNLGNILAQQDRMADAFAHYEQALRLRPDYVDAHVNAGNALLQLDRVAPAISHYETALRLNPASPDAHNNLGLVLLHTGRPREAITHFEQALAARPNFGDAQRNLAEARAQLRRGP